VGTDQLQHLLVVLDQVAPGELAGTPEFLEGAGIPACLDATLKGPVLVDAAGLFLFLIEDAVPGSGSLPDLDQLFREQAVTALDIHVDGFTPSQGVEFPRREKTLGPEAYVFHMQRGAAATTAFAAAKAVRSRGVGDLHQAVQELLPALQPSRRLQSFPLLLQSAKAGILSDLTSKSRESVLHVERREHVAKGLLELRPEILSTC
jgi:hypothetical protein